MSRLKATVIHLVHKRENNMLVRSYNWNTEGVPFVSRVVTFDDYPRVQEHLEKFSLVVCRKSSKVIQYEEWA